MVSAPKAPDPYETANAQGGMNRDTAISQQLLNFTNQYTPDGSLVYTQNGSTGFTDSQGNWIEIPRFDATVSLSPEQQRIKEQSDGATFNLAKIAKDQSAFLGDYLGKPVDTSGLPALKTSIGGPYNANFSGNIDGGYDTSFGRDIGGSYRDTIGGDYTTTYAGADDFSADRQRYEDALWDRQAGDRAQAQDRLRTQLINSGLRPGTAAWDSEMARLSRSENDSRLATILAAGDEQARMVGMARDAAQFGNDAEMNRFIAQNAASAGKAQFAREGQLAQNAAAMGQAQFGQQAQALSNDAAYRQAAFGNQARAQGMGELFAARNQPINEISALLGGGQVSMPNFIGTPQTGVAGVDYTGLVNQKYKSEMDAYQSGMGGLFGLGSALIGALPFSDRRLKTDIRRVGVTGDGVPIYVYRYKGDDTVHMGVMAQDVPHAAVLDPSGFYRVDYERVH